MSKTTGTGILASLASDSVSFLAKKDKNNPVLKNVKTGRHHLLPTGRRCSPQRRL